MSEYVRLLVDKKNTDSADATFCRIIECITLAKSSIYIHMFVWRSDDIGNRIADALLVAAKRGVRIHIVKDTDALLYEFIEMNGKPLFNQSLPFLKRLSYKIMSFTFPDTYVKDDFGFELGEQLRAHPNVTMQWVHHTHSKYYIFDNEIMLTGSINIEDRHRNYWDYMIELKDSSIIQRFRQRQIGTLPFDNTLHLEFIINRTGCGVSGFEIKPFILHRLALAKCAVYIEMAYIGDPDVSNAIIAASQRGVEVRMLFSKKANIGNDINYKTMHEIAIQCPIKIYLTSKMIHSKLMLFDNETVIVGSANISVYSMQKGAELDLVISNNAGFMQVLGEEIQRRIEASEEITDIGCLMTYNSFLAALQQLHQQLA